MKRSSFNGCRTIFPMRMLKALLTLEALVKINKKALLASKRFKRPLGKLSYIRLNPKLFKGFFVYITN